MILKKIKYLRKLRNEEGYVTVLFALLLPIILMFAGIILDGSLLVYKQNSLMSSVKYAVLSSTSEYEMQSGQVFIDENDAKDLAKKVLKENMNEAKLITFSVNDNQCYMEAQVKVDFYFMKLFNIESRTLKAEYYASRNKSK